MPIILDPDPVRAAAAAMVLPDGATTVAEPAELTSVLTGRPGEYVVVIGPHLPIREAAEISDSLRRSHPSAGIVLIRSELSTAVFESAMEAGIPAVVAVGDQAALATAVGRARRTWEAIHGPSHELGDGGRILTVFSPKGGVGKTTLAVNLAVAIAKTPGQRVCLVDLDLSFGDVAITLQLIPQHTIDEAIGAEASIDFALLEQLLTTHPANLKILAAPMRPDTKDRISPALVSSVLTTLRRHFDFVIVDTSPGFEEAVLQSLDHTDELILVATLDVPTVKNVKMAIETLDLLDLVKGHRHLVLNRADDAVGLSPKDVEGILKMPVRMAIPTDVAVANATNHGTPIILAQPQHLVAAAIATLAGELGVPTVTSTEPHRRRGLLRRGNR
jgi:pilus assembly protein CpaE